MSSIYFDMRPTIPEKPDLVAIPQDQIAAFYRELRSPLCASLRRWRLSAEEVEDVVQEAFVRLLSHGPEDLNAESVRYWLFRVVQNLAIDRYRSGWRGLLESQTDFDILLSISPSQHFDPEKVYLDYERWRVVQDNLATLTPRQRHAIDLWISGLSHKAIAYQVKGTTKSVAELIRRGLKRLGEDGGDSKT